MIASLAATAVALAGLGLYLAGMIHGRAQAFAQAPPRLRIRIDALTLDGRRTLYAMDAETAADLQVFSRRALRIDNYEVHITRVDP